MFEAQKEEVLVKEAAMDAEQEEGAAKEGAVATTDEAQGIGLQVGFKVFFQLLL